MKKYYLHDGHNQNGPYDIEELKTKNLTHETFVWFDSLNTWTPIGEIEELKHLLSSVPPQFEIPQPPPFSNPEKIESINWLKENFINKRTLVIRSSIFFIIIVAIVYFVNHQSNNKFSDSISALDTSAQYQEDKRKLDSLDNLEKERRLRNEALTKKNMEYRNNWRKYIEHQPINFKVGSFGGISDLQIYVSNSTDNIIDEVIVQIFYYKANGELYTSKEISVYNIQPNSDKTVKVENTDRGTRIKTSILKITSRSIHFCYDWEADETDHRIHTESPSRNPLDPWYCK